MKHFRWLTVMIMLIAVPAFAQDDFDFARLSRLVESGRMEEAYHLADDYSDTYAGDVRFDFYYGIAAIGSGHVGVGVFALDRVLMQRPGLARARLEYARGLFLQGDDRRARRQFEIVLAQDPPTIVSGRIERYMVAIDRRADRYRTTVSGYIGTKFGFDGNVNRGPDARSVDLGFGTLLLDPQNLDQDDVFYGVDGGVNISRPVVPGLNLIASLVGSIHENEDESDFDTSRGRGRIGLRWIQDRHRVAGFFGAERFYLGGEGYQYSGEFLGNYRYRLGNRRSVHATVQTIQLRHDTVEELDSTLWFIGGGFSDSWKMTWNPRGRVTILFGQENAEENSRRALALAERDIIEFRGRFAATPAPEWELTSSVRWRSSEYETNTFPFTKTRDEDFYSMSVNLNWRLTAQWRIGPRIAYSRNDSNLDLFEYERNVAEIRARYTFF